MQLGNRKELDKALFSLMRQFDEMWMKDQFPSERAYRAARCAHKLHHTTIEYSAPNLIVLPTGGRMTAPHIMLACGGTFYR